MRVNVRSGDTLWYYGQMYMVPVQLIIDSNPGVDIRRLTPGQEIEIPGYKVKHYTVKAGDSFIKISSARRMPVDAFLLINQQVNPSNLIEGQTISIPEKIIAPVLNGKQNYDYKILCNDISKLTSLYPFVKVNEIGKSVMGKPIHELRLGKGDLKVHFNASFHANEWITSAILMRLLNTFLAALTTGSLVYGKSAYSLYKRVDLSIVPMVNPDGVDLVLNGPTKEEREKVIAMNNGSEDFSPWKANIRGIDLNNQYPANWEIEKQRKEPKSPSARDYPGDAPLTEPEAIVMKELADRNQFDRVICFHTQGEEFYWGYEGKEPSDSELLAEEFSRVSGYKSVRYVDSHAGYKDWYINEYQKKGFTMELGNGVNPLPIKHFDKILQDSYGLFFAGLYM